MSRYSVLLVDDEEEVIRIIMKKMDWESMGFTVVGYAHNGVEALEMAEDLQPDVVLTDIKMPYMDGLTMSRKLKEQHRSTRIIIFTGFDEFEYAKEAIDIEVEQYILKPVDAEELHKVFSRIREDLDRERDEKQNVDKLKEYYLESLPLLQESFYTSLIEGRIPENQIARYLSSYQISLEGPYYVAAILHVSTSAEPAQINPFLLTVSVKKLAEEQIAPKYDSKTMIYLGDVLVITQFESPQEITGYTDFMDEFCRQALRVCDARVTAGIGQVCSKLQDLRLSYQGAGSAVSYRAIYGNTRAINIAEIDPQQSGDESWESQAIQAILKKIRMGDHQELEEKIADCMRHFTEHGTSLQKYRIFIMELVTEISRFGNNNQLNMEELFGDRGNFMEKALQVESPEELRKWISEVGSRMQEAVQKERQNTTKSFVTKAVEYVQESYSDITISIESVCRKLGVSAAYFSTVFKKETGKTFIGYLTDYRMEQAVELLLTTDDKTYIIAEKVGYADPNYFSYVFKKQYGMAPSKYRTGKLKERE
jgi:two-component system response regulator YesN